MIETALTSIGLNLVSSFVYEAGKKALGSARQMFAPCIVQGRHRPFLKAADTVFYEEIESLRKNTKVEALRRYFDDPNLAKNEVVIGIISELIYGARWNSSSYNNLISDFSDVNDRYTQTNYDDVLHRLRDDIRGRLVTNKKTSDFLMHKSIEHIKGVLDNLPDEHSLSQQLRKDSVNAEVEQYSRAYMREWQSAVKILLVHGLDSATKREQIRNDLRSSYISIGVSQDVTIEGEGFQRADAEDALRTMRKVILRGNAGSGKTTLLHKIILDFDNSSAADFFSQDIPIYIPLRRIEKNIEAGYSIESAVKDSLLGKSYIESMPIGWIESLASLSSVTFMFDGIDEVRSDNRSKVWDLISETEERFPTSKFVVTSRNISAVHFADGAYRTDIFERRETYTDYLESWRPPASFFDFVIEPLTNSEVAQFIDKWFEGVDVEALPPHDRKDVEGYSEKLKAALFLTENRRSLELARSPLLCALFCIVAFVKQGTLPSSRKDLYSRATALLVETRDERRGVDVSARFASFSLEQRLRVLQFVALTMQEGAATGSADQAIEVSKDKVISWLDNWLERQYDAWNFDGADLLKFLVDRCSIIREPSGQVVDFAHRSFMEYLSAEEIAIERPPHSIRDTILKDEWYHTLEFCMHTSEGAGHFAGLLFGEISDFIKQQKKTTIRRNLRFRLISLLKSTGPLPNMYDDKVRECVEDLLPFVDSMEALELKGVPARILNRVLRFSDIEHNYDYKQCKICAELLARHPSDETKVALLSGYEKMSEREVIKVINSFGKLSVSEHFALRKRIENGSYRDTVVFKADELSDRSLRSGLRNIHSGRPLSNFGIRFPLLGEEFVGWDIVHYATSVKMIGVTKEDLIKLNDSVKTWRFDKCKRLELAYCNGVSFSDLAGLFPVLEAVEFTRGQGISFSGIRNFDKLRDIWLVGLTQPIRIVSSDLPARLELILLSNSTRPVIEGKQNKCKIEVDESAFEKSIYSVDPG